LVGGFHDLRKRVGECVVACSRLQRKLMQRDSRREKRKEKAGVVGDLLGVEPKAARKGDVRGGEAGDVRADRL
jgi:hypothetical protein